MSSEMKRVKVLLEKPNPLFEQWLQEWKEEAAARGSDMQYCFGKALTSLKKYPLPLKSGRDCAILQNFGNRLCVMLDRKLAEHRKKHPEESDVHFTCNSVHVDEINEAESSSTKNTMSQKSKQPKKVLNNKEKQQSSPQRKTTKRRNEEYIPAYRSGPYAILIALLSCSKEDGYPGFMTKIDLQNAAQPLCDASFTKPQGNSHYTAWSSMATLLKRGLVTSAGRGKYTLSTEGETLAKNIQSIHNVETDDEILSGPSNTHLSVESRCVPISSGTIKVDALPISTVPSVGKRKLATDVENTMIFASGSFDIILLIDTQEVSGNGSDQSLVNDFKKNNVISEVRRLKIGDFIWICREHTTGHEIVLPYIIERKRVDDFAHSIMDGRFREQKFRLKQCGIPNLIYLVEKHGRESHTALPLATLNQAAANTEVTDGFIVKYTANHKESTSYLAYFTLFLKNIFTVKTLVQCCKKDIPHFSIQDDLLYLMSFQEFNSLSIKNKKLAVGDMFIKHLVQLNGLSVEKALAIVEKYPTPYTLYRAFKTGGETTMLADIRYGSLNRRIGPVLSKALFELYSNSILA